MAGRRGQSVAYLHVGREVVGRVARRAKIDHFDLAARVRLDEDVLWLEVAVDEVELVHKVVVERMYRVVGALVAQIELLYRRADAVAAAAIVVHVALRLKTRERMGLPGHILLRLEQAMVVVDAVQRLLHHILVFL